ncbi:SsrA-binding protein [Candidatus Wolfebacteria bacterium RIFOXYB2_FULL_49_7]|uniref:SsrA-binding protein n=1 Tax=Candidatus Wolfebacteria bacterium RIFOXYB1_FULL_54_12 TaxID=1802559 RepID=A0A1F8DUY5_9BACT|nr:MAG: SsrA-binding protein [Candidatus Wolfebacteria bacterium RIFOXYB1_FULL_54_12]OGM96555.1 MAG: SsrA-binding protein [Candidatus Wolfebacteria bacterium RIFOXYB2_FULL_49_7]
MKDFMSPIENKRATFDYTILETFEAGLELLGTEVQAIKHGRMNLSSTYVLLRNGIPLLFNADVQPYQPKNAPKDYNPTRTRRLLLTAKEIKYLTGKIEEKGLTLVPLKVYTKHQRIKVLIGLAKSRKEHDKREAIKKREDWKQIRKDVF